MRKRCYKTIVNALSLAMCLSLSAMTHARYEAEDASNTSTSTGTFISGYSGSAYSRYTQSGDYVEFLVNADSAEQHDLTISYANITENTSVSISVNGSLVETNLLLPASSSWQWQTVSTLINLNAGTNTITISSNDTVRFPLDYIEVENETPIENANPIADASHSSPLSGNAPLTVSFDATGSTDDGEIVSYHWDLGNGVTDSNIVTNYTYSEPGIYTVTLIVTDDIGVSSSTELIVEVLEELISVNELRPDLLKYTVDSSVTSLVIPFSDLTNNDLNAPFDLENYNIFPQTFHTEAREVTSNDTSEDLNNLRDEPGPYCNSCSIERNNDSNELIVNFPEGFQGDIRYTYNTSSVPGSAHLTVRINVPEVNERKIFTFGHSLFNHNSESSEPNYQTNTAWWINYFGRQNDEVFIGNTGRFGQYSNHAMSIERSGTSISGDPFNWVFRNDEISARSTHDINEESLEFVIIMPSSQAAVPPEEYLATERDQLINFITENISGATIVMYEHWTGNRSTDPDCANTSDCDQWLPSEPFWESIRETSRGTGEFHSWMKAHEESIEQVHGVQVYRIPVGPVIDDLIEKYYMSEVTYGQLYEDGGRHGRAPIYFLAAAICYHALDLGNLNNISPPANNEIARILDEQVFEIIRNNWTDIVQTIEDGVLQHGEPMP